MFLWFRNKVPEPIRFVLSGGVGSFLFYLLNESILALVHIPWEPVTVAFFLSYCISIGVQYFLHAYLVFGPDENLVKGLLSCYGGYSLALFASTPINYSLVNHLHASAFQAWLGTLLITGVANYILLTYLLGGSKEKNV